MEKAKKSKTKEKQKVVMNVFIYNFYAGHFCREEEEKVDVETTFCNKWDNDDQSGGIEPGSTSERSVI